MAQDSSAIFNKKATEKLRSPDDLDKYVRVTNPSVWVVLAACIALLAGLLIWGVFGAVTTNVVVTGTLVDSEDVPVAAGGGNGTTAMCFLSADDVAKVEVGDVSIVGGEQMRVSKIAPVPASPDEWESALQSEYLAKSLFNGDWAYPVVFEGDISNLEKGIPVVVRIETDRIAPISLILRGRG